MNPPFFSIFPKLINGIPEVDRNFPLYERPFSTEIKSPSVFIFHPFGILPNSESSNAVIPSKSTNHDLKIACAICSRILFWL